MDRHPMFFCYRLVYFRSVCWVLSTLNMFSFAFLSLFCNCLLILVLKSCISCKYVLRPNLKYIDVREIFMRWLILLLLAQLCDLVTTLVVEDVDGISPCSC